MGVLGFGLKKLGDVLMGTVAEGYAQDAKNAIKNAFKDTLESVMSGKRSFEEWGDIVQKTIDNTIARAIEEEGLCFVSGYLKFYVSKNDANKIVIAYELYFVDSGKQWIKKEAQSDVYASNFTQDALAEIEKSHIVKFEVTN
jgi:hypothetical protein